MSNSPLSTRLLQTVGISSSLILSGLITGTSVVFVPRIMELPTPLLVRLWNKMYDQGKSRIGPLAIVPLLTYSYLAYSEHRAAFPAQWKVNSYAAAGALAAGIVPYTILAMRRTNEILMEKAAEMRSLKNTDNVVEIGLAPAETAHKLLDIWALLNLGRAALMATSGVVGVWTVLN
jgi:hypothetical protein